MNGLPGLIEMKGLIIKLDKKTRRGFGEGGIREGETGEGEIGEGGCEETFLCLCLTLETRRFTKPPAVA